MSYKNDSRLIILAVASTVVILGGVVLGVVMSVSGNSANGATGGTAELTIDSSYYDFGNVSMAKGLSRHVFNLKNEGTGDLKISNITTSCMCTTAVLEVDGKRSPAFGMPGHGGANSAFWSAVLKPGQSAQLEAIFDPNAHGPDATGPITRAITFYSNDGGKDEIRSTITFAANVVK